MNWQIEHIRKRVFYPNAGFNYLFPLKTCKDFLP